MKALKDTILVDAGRLRLLNWWTVSTLRYKGKSTDPNRVRGWRDLQLCLRIQIVAEDQLRMAGHLRCAMIDCTVYAARAHTRDGPVC